MHHNQQMIKNLPGTKLVKSHFLNLTLIGCTFVLFQCHKNNQSAEALAVFDSVPATRVLLPLVSEISGIADSKINPGFLWAHEDSGTPPQLHLIGHDGNVSKQIYLAGISNRDWEDIVLFRGDIYIAETGDNALAFSSYKFYKFPEPAAGIDTVATIQTIHFRYPDGPHDAEAFLIDASTRNIYILTKRDNPSKIYRLSYPYNSSNNTVTLVGTLPYSGVVSAASSGDEIIIKTYTNLFYYKQAQNESIERSLQKPFSNMPYVMEPQGEAVSFASNGSGFYTISEKAWASEVKIFYYRRK